ncbi:MATH and LRR domain-containing protein PFE0570w-like isoform X2 [Lucilia cuprina]|uniref:MATH and LRR domain-containing protein PFE0570w-like isoform X2 n=1 Tax=Lucilia cuprina TaxID=7375 RepID=UPI001F065575|nr:MATH and LRR domain-containing protein PFE0570w-like isoform X2 [Lucilia cuprina]
MTNNNTNDNKIPTTWKKYGEVYCNNLEQSVFVCSICLQNADNINMTYTTSDGSAFWCHIQQQHISVEYETIDKISEEIRNFTKNEVETKEENEGKATKMEESADFKIKNTQIKLLEEFHENLIKNNVLKETEDSDIFHEINIEGKSQETHGSSEGDDVKPNIKVENMEKYEKKFSNCNYYYDNETYIISDDDDDDDEYDNDEEVIFTENNDILNHKDEPKPLVERNYLKHNDMIEISDDEDNQDHIDTLPISPISTNEDTSINEVINTMEIETSDSNQKNHPIEFDNVSSTNNEGNISYQPNTNIMHLTTGIPTPDVSPCESMSTQHLNIPQDNQQTEGYYSNSESNRLHHLPKKRVANFRAFKCNICGSRTINKTNMEKHLQRVHNVSPQEFKSNEFSHQRYHLVQQPYHNNQQNSETMHLLKKPFKCKICNARTRTEINMKTHQILHHSPDSHIFTIVCGICKKKVLRTKFQRHLLYHTLSGHKCDYCGIVYKQKYYLNIHIRKYHSESNLCSVPEYYQQINTNFNIPPEIYLQNNQQHNNQSTIVTSTFNSTDVNLSSAEEQQLRYQKCEQIWKLFESSNNM